MDFSLAIEIADEARDGGYTGQTEKALYLLADNCRAALQGLKAADALLSDAGFGIDSPERSGINSVRGMLMANAVAKGSRL